MESSWSPEARKQEWKNLRLLRLRQVQEQSKQISKQMIEITKEKRIKKKSELKEKREAALNEWKKTQIDELEAKYNSAMEQVGLAARQAEIENESRGKLLVKEAENLERAKKRGQLAEQTQIQRLNEMMEKENAPIRRKQMIREIEDIRSGLVVQSKDWKVINLRDREILSDVPQNSNAPAREMKKKGWSAKQSSGKKSSKAKTPKKSAESSKVLSDPPTRSPLNVPAFTENLEELVSSCRVTTTESPSKRRTGTNLTNTAKNATYKIASCPCPSENHLQRSADDRAASRLEDHLSTERFTPRSDGEVTKPTNRNFKLDDEEMNALLERYRPSHSPQFKRGRSELLNLTPPTHEQDESPPTAKSRKRVKSHRKNSGCTTSETKKLFAAIDKALERGRRMRGELSESGSFSSSSSDSEEEEQEREAVVKLVVNVNCRQSGHGAIDVEESSGNDVGTKPSSQKRYTERTQAESHEILSKETRDKKQEVKATKNASTEVGASLQASNSSHPTTQSTECSGGKDSCDSHETAAPCLPQYFHYLQEPVKRSSTVEDLSLRTPSKGATLLHSMTDLSSIMDDSPQKEVSSRREALHVPINLAQDLSNKSLSSTVYLDLEEKLKDGSSEKEDSFQVNPVLDYYIRKLLNQPAKLVSGRNTVCCECPSIQSAVNNDRLPSAPPPVDISTPDRGADVVEEPTKPSTKADIAIPSRVLDADAERLKRLEKIAALERQLSEIRRVRLTSSSSSGRSSTTSSGKSISSTASSPTERLEEPLEKNHRLSTIVEVDSRVQDDVHNSSLPSEVAMLLEKQLIYRPFRWARRGSTSSTNSHQSKSSDDTHDTRVEHDASQTVPQLDFSSILSLGSDYNLNQHSVAAGISPPPGLDLTHIISRMDLTTLSSLLDQR